MHSWTPLLLSHVFAALTSVVLVGYQGPSVANLFASCEVVARLENYAGVPNEEQDAPVAVCTDPVLPWSRLWPRFAHLD